MRALPAVNLRLISGGRPDADQTPVPSPAWMDGLCRDLENGLRLLLPPTDLSGLAGAIAELLGPVRIVQAVPLPDEDKVHVEGERLVVDPEYAKHLASLPAQERLRRFVLYAVHEVAHIKQGISEKRRVHELHAAEGEEALLRLDLEADYAAARYAAVILHHDFAALRRSQLASLRAFPVGTSHRPAERHRKARRAASLATDIVARERGLLTTAEVAEIYWARGGGPAMVVAHGAFGRRLVTVLLSPADAGKLDAAASEDEAGRRTSALLKVVGRALDAGGLARLG